MRIVGHLLAYSRQQRLQPEAVEINRVVQSTADLLRGSLGARWAIRCELAPRLELVMADAAQIQTALLNLAINARDAMPAGGTVTFETSLIENDGMDLPRELAGTHHVAIRVKDTGTGMAAEVAMKAFDPFFTTKEQGTGLGLSQIYGLAKQLGGTATIDTAQHNGTTVTIYLPVTQAAPTGTQDATDVKERPRRRSDPDSSPRIVLVADDDPQVREFVCATMADAGYAIVEAQDGPSALDALLREPVDLALLDISMPGMSGIEVYKRAQECGRNGAVLFISGFADPAIVDDIPGKPFLTKPFRGQTLKAQVAHILAEKDARSAERSMPH
jgi:CheY-like chemotaxis protein/two-component sensor histidine kinase